MSTSNIAHINSPTVSLAVTTASGSVAYGVAGNFALISNIGSSTAYVKSGDSTVTAVIDTNVAIPAGAMTVLRRDRLDTHIAAVTSTGTTTIVVSTTEGA